MHRKTIVETLFAYEDLCTRFEAAVGRLDAPAVRRLEASAAPWPEVEAATREMAGDSGLMKFAVFDQGAVASLSGSQIRCRLYLVGNPAIAARIVRIDERGALYVPFREAVYATPRAAGRGRRAAGGGPRAAGGGRDDRIRSAFVIAGGCGPARARRHRPLARPRDRRRGVGGNPRRGAGAE
ncbi:hypothetical protein [Phenylobacterium sp.]|uniref:hypothetical protein n=1 Tax=Phenylobacterium sp. TaxID=1871053 RepID=UPI002E2FE4B9|nr:hypothetical protein [Phenylobacterium sp.]HEX3365900.1 hypothetical protein [Phenylobacterium sp.]